MTPEFKELKKALAGELHDSRLWRSIYATDASVYQEFPLAVAVPKSREDIRKIIDFARDNALSITPRTGGTSQSGQAVGKGIVVDVSKYMNRILEINATERWVRVEPGVVRDELNRFLKPHGLFFSPITSTANRAMIGGMVGNNSCGSNSIVYGSTRDHVIGLETILSDGAECSFGPLNMGEFMAKCEGKTLENKVYRQIFAELNDPARRQSITEGFPKRSIERRNTGYAVDLLLGQLPFQEEGPDFNFCTLLCGSEGTLAFTTEIKLHLDPLPPTKAVVVAIHCHSVLEALKAAQIAMKLRPDKCELIDKVILDCTKANRKIAQNRFFLEGDPGAVLLVEFRAEKIADAGTKADLMTQNLNSDGLGYAFPKVLGPNIGRVWALRKAGLGVLGNLPGDAKSVSCIEDTAVALEDLPEYIEEFEQMMQQFGQNVVYYAHAGAGELHLRPILNMKTAAGQEAFYEISKSTAHLVKKYRGSLSGEHGDGRVRAEFIPLIIGEENYELLRRIKATWDPHHIFNAGKIVDAPPMKGDFRYEADQAEPKIDTVMDFSDTGGYLRMIEKCNGVGACRKLPGSGGTMCPSYMATRNEKDTTRARANALRVFLSNSASKELFDAPEVHEILKYCLSCKGCTTECPSSVDMSALKAEFLHQYYQHHRRPVQDLVFGNIDRLGKLASNLGKLSNHILENRLLSSLMKRWLNLTPERALPQFAPFTLMQWWRKNRDQLPETSVVKGSVYFYCDEFTNYQDVANGIAAIRLLNGLGYEVLPLEGAASGRAQLSKGLLRKAKKLANRNVEFFAPMVSAEQPLIGIEPSAILTFRDEYLRLADQRQAAEQLKSCVFMLEEFLVQEAKKGRISAGNFSDRQETILLHGHCHQKSLAGIEASAFALGLPQNFTVEVIPSGCCGMAGSFGYEKDNYELSMRIGELVLFPAVRKAENQTIIAAPGISCRHQVEDGTGRQARHPAAILYSVLAKKS